MANAENKAGVLQLDTAGTTLIKDGPVFIKKIRWTGATTAGNTATIQNKEGATIWTSVATGANYVEDALIEQWHSGVIMPTLTTGTIELSMG